MPSMLTAATISANSTRLCAAWRRRCWHSRASRSNRKLAFSKQHDAPEAVGNDDGAIGPQGGGGPDRRLRVVVEDQSTGGTILAQDVPDGAACVQGVGRVHGGLHSERRHAR